MVKLLAVLRTLALVFIVGYTVRAMPWFGSVPRTLDEQYARCAGSLDLLVRAAWISVAWIAFETAVGWWMATRGGRPQAARPPGSSRA